MGGQDARRLHHPVEVVGSRLPADEDDALARLPACLGGVGVEDDRARRGARRGVQALRDDLHLGRRVDHRVQQLVELRRIDAGDRFLLRDQPLLDHLHRRPERRRRGSLRRPRLQEEERSLLDRELDVLHVAVVLLEPARSSPAAARTPPAAARSCARSARACGCPRRRPRPARSGGTRRRACSPRSTGHA